MPRDEFLKHAPAFTGSAEPFTQKLARELSFARGTAAQRVKARKKLTEQVITLPQLSGLKSHKKQLAASPFGRGMLLFRRERERPFPDARTQAARYSGVDRSEVDRHARHSSLLPRAVEDAIGFV